MTVKELKEILDGCNDDASVVVGTDMGHFQLLDANIYQFTKSNEVVIDIYGECEENQ